MLIYVSVIHLAEKLNEKCVTSEKERHYTCNTILKDLLILDNIRYQDGVMQPDVKCRYCHCFKDRFYIYKTM